MTDYLQQWKQNNYATKVMCPQRRNMTMDTQEIDKQIRYLKSYKLSFKFKQNTHI